jgi:hypothetical protein
MGERPLADVPVAVRMSWAATRETTREEDMAYCLLGIFDVNMPMLYGEGEKAFIRLQEEIIKQSPDMSIFAWKASTDMDYSGLLARSPAEFKDAGGLTTNQDELLGISHFSITNRGIRFNNVPSARDPFNGLYILSVNHGNYFHNLLGPVGVYLRQVGPDLFVCQRPSTLGELRDHAVAKFVGSIQVVKALSTEQSAAIDTRVTYIREPDQLEHPNFLLSEAQPPGCWDPSQKMFFAGHTGVFLGYLNFTPTWADEFESFVLVCRFDSVRLDEPWRYALVRGDDWTRIRPQYQEHYVYSYDGFLQSSRQEELSLDLPHL